jgi:MraZ protein
MFIGEYSHSIDDKGRLTIPARFRAALAEGCFVSRGFDKHLIVYTRADFEVLSNKARKLSLTNLEHRDLWRMFYGAAHEDSPDNQGRIQVPQFLRDYAGLEGEVRIVGVGQFIEVWAAAAWNDKQQQLNDPATNADRFASLDLSTAGD